MVMSPRPCGTGGVAWVLGLRRKGLHMRGRRVAGSRPVDARPVPDAMEGGRTPLPARLSP